jgi:alpha-L-fucosidase
MQSEWAVVPSELCFRSEKQTDGALLEGDLSFLYNADKSLGELETIAYSKSLVFCGAEIDMSIRRGWFYHEREEAHSLERLFNTYVNACGANAGFILNIPPMQNGRFHPNDVIRLGELGKALRDAFGEEKKIPITVREIGLSAHCPYYQYHNKEACATVDPQDEAPGTQSKYEILLPEKRRIAWVNLMENIAEGQRISTFRLLTGDGRCVYQGFTVGHRKLCRLENVEADRLVLHITSARDKADMRSIDVYAE